MQPKKISFSWENFTFLIMILFTVYVLCACGTIKFKLISCGCNMLALFRCIHFSIMNTLTAFLKFNIYVLNCCSFPTFRTCFLNDWLLCWKSFNLFFRLALNVCSRMLKNWIKTDKWCGEPTWVSNNLKFQICELYSLLKTSR